MHLLESGVSLDMIRDFLGHVDVKTTQIYARANLEMKRNALEKINESSLVQNDLHAGSRTRTFLTGSVLCNRSQDMRVCQA
jgi:site-specific recombinase XerC